MDYKYLPRVLETVLKDKLASLGAVLIEGPKWCGKTTTGKKMAASVLDLANPDTLNQYKQTSDVKPSLLLSGDKPLLIDEWQEIPVLWDAIRTDLDNNPGQFGRYILTGSTVVDEKKIMHSGTGRIDRRLMKPLSLFESEDSNGTISLLSLFDDKYDIDGKKSDLSIERLIYVACRGGWPGSLFVPDERLALDVVKSLVKGICESDISRVDYVKRDRRLAENILRAYARNISTLVKDVTLMNDLRLGAYPELSSATFYSYLGALEKLFIIEEIEAWSPKIRSAANLRTSNKKAFVDPSIAVAVLGLSPETLMKDLLTFGFIFENLCLRDLSIYVQAYDGHIAHYHDRFELEADAVVTLADGRYALVECKLGRTGIDKGAENLLKITERIKQANASMVKEQDKIDLPAALIILTGNAPLAYTRPDGVKVVPIGCLKP